jgi:hypothetical protein
MVGVKRAASRVGVGKIGRIAIQCERHGRRAVGRVEVNGKRGLHGAWRELAGRFQAHFVRRLGVAEKFTNLAPLVTMFACFAHMTLMADRLLNGAAGGSIAARQGVLGFHVVVERRFLE